MMLMNTMPAQEHLCDITENVWMGFLDLPLQRSTGLPVACECAASIMIEGAWNGQVVVACSRRLAQRVAAVMFQCEDSELREALWADALNEIANIIGGNVKSLLPSPSRLGLPHFHTAWVPPESGQVATFSSEGDALHVLLIEASG
ncbi:MAG: chemotaxis protein CheX [Moraxellaceae bacterium]|nr:chemotaxis protein CheX [Moraxellaceae bacterium]